MQTITTKSDSRGRICLGRRIVERYGQEFVIIATPQDITLLPSAKDPIKELQEESRKLPKVSVAELKKKIREQAAKDLG